MRNGVLRFIHHSVNVYGVPLGTKLGAQCWAESSEPPTESNSQDKTTGQLCLREKTARRESEILLAWAVPLTTSASSSVNERESQSNPLGLSISKFKTLCLQCGLKSLKEHPTPLHRTPAGERAPGKGDAAEWQRLGKDLPSHPGKAVSFAAGEEPPASAPLSVTRHQGEVHGRIPCTR